MCGYTQVDCLSIHPPPTWGPGINWFVLTHQASCAVTLLVFVVVENPLYMILHAIVTYSEVS